MVLPLKNGLVDWKEWHSQIVKENLELALGARENAKKCRPDKYLSDAGWVRFYRRKAVQHIKIANAHKHAARSYTNG